jgi:NTP pyrophosphatase (non-canonical NTP hydrolase)
MHLDDPSLDAEKTEELVWSAMEQVSGITTNKAKLVASSKALHHVLPELIPPIDRWYTARFFSWHGPEMQTAQRRVFRRTWMALADVAKRVQVGRFIASGWRSSRGKLVDNAVVGFCLAELSSPEVLGPDLTSTQAVLEDFAEERDWNQFHTPKNLAMALATEVGELLEIFQWLTDQQARELSKEDRDRVAEELADMQIYIARMADVLSLDISAAVESKIQANADKYPVDLSRGNATKYNRRDR